MGLSDTFSSISKHQLAQEIFVFSRVVPLTMDYVAVINIPSELQESEIWVWSGSPGGQMAPFSPDALLPPASSISSSRISIPPQLIRVHVHGVRVP